MRRDEAFTDFAARTSGRLRAVAYLTCGDWDRAADHVQEGLVKVYLAWPRVRRNGQEYAYARRCVVNAAIDASRRRSSTEVAVDHTTLPAPDLVSDHAGPVVDRAVVLAALAQLPARQRACVVLRFYEDLGVVETAKALGCSEGTVKSQTSRALATLRRLLGDDVTFSFPGGTPSTEGALR